MSNEVIIAIIGFMSTALSPIITYVIIKQNEKHKFLQSQYVLKQNVFLTFDQSLATFKLLSHCDSPQVLVGILLNCHKLANVNSKEKIMLSLKSIEDYSHSKTTINDLLSSLENCSFALSSELALDKRAIVGKSRK